MNNNNSLPQIFRAVNRNGSEGRYYFVKNRNIVPGQVSKNNEPMTFKLSNYEVVPHPGKRDKSSSGFNKIKDHSPKFSYQCQDQQIDKICQEIGWTLTRKAKKAIQIWNKNPMDLQAILKGYKINTPDLNVLDYNSKTNCFVAKH